MCGNYILSYLDHNIKFWSTLVWCSFKRTLNCHLVVEDEYNIAC